MNAIFGILEGAETRWFQSENRNIPDVSAIRNSPSPRRFNISTLIAPGTGSWVARTARLSLGNYRAVAAQWNSGLHNLMQQGLTRNETAAILYRDFQTSIQRASSEPSQVRRDDHVVKL